MRVTDHAHLPLYVDFAWAQNKSNNNPLGESHFNALVKIDFAFKLSPPFRVFIGVEQNKGYKK